MRILRIGLATMFSAAVAFSTSALAADPDAALAELQSKVLSSGPNGETPAPASDVQLSAEELQK